MLFLLLLVFVASTVLSADIPTTHGETTKICVNLTVPVTVTSANYIWGLSKWETDYDVAAFNAAMNNVTASTSLNPLSGFQEETASYNISGTFCKPVVGSASTVLLATHGITLNKYYWDSRYQPSNYSFVDFVTSKGYAIFFYDRLGAGQSSRISGYVNQGSIQVAILEQLVGHVRNGYISQVTKIRPKKVVLIGHSYGSGLTNALLAVNPTIADAAILTGWSYSISAALVLAIAQPRIANLASPKLYAGYDNGYVSFVDIYASAQLFYYQNTFDVGAAQYLHDTASPTAIMELISLATLNFTAPKVTAPVLYLVGEYDSSVCEGYCPGSLLPTARNMFPASVGFDTYIQLGTGHMLNFQYNATGTFKVVTNFLAKNGF